MIDVRDVSKSFGPLRVLDHVSVTVPAGRTTVLLGPSGGGKSTLLRVMNGLIQPDAGDVRFDGEPVTPANSRRLRHRMGYVVQDGGEILSDAGLPGLEQVDTMDGAARRAAELAAS